MHEMSLSEGVLLAIEESARKEHFARATRVQLEIGELSSVDADSLAFCFDVVTRGSLAEGARLEIVRTPGTGWCMPCERAIDLARDPGSCPHCGSYQVQITGGTQMRILELTVE
jgi:hydrogenase nickel incorporation protein HypA/HybF